MKPAIFPILAFALWAPALEAQTRPCRTHTECLYEREVLRERQFDHTTPSVMFELRRLQQQDESARQTEDIMRQWDQQRSPGGYPCMPHEARCRQ
jgi:hypothetical protein